MNRVMIQEGYSLPFDGVKKSKRKGKAKKRTAKAKKAGAAFGRKMRACGKRWAAKSDKFRKTHKWTAFVKKVC